MMLPENTKTIRMPQSVWDKWEAALLDPESKQGVGALCDGEGGYCCLGLLQMAVDGKVETLTEKGLKELEHEFSRDEMPALGAPALTPSKDWLHRHGITFTPSKDWLHRHGITFRSKYSGGVRVPEVKNGGVYDMVSELNDGGKSFAEILKLMRPHVETY